ncbi:hypothetical protein NN561_016371 [Cricetulus griseus]
MAAGWHCSSAAGSARDLAGTRRASAPGRCPHQLAWSCTGTDSRLDVTTDPKESPRTDGVYLDLRPATSKERQAVGIIVVVQAELATDVAVGTGSTCTHQCGWHPACMRSPTPTWPHKSGASSY